MIHFSRLRLSGFKSFVEKTELDIGHGLTGVVGPNGCGKSNLVEALRWVMGENSAKSMRGDGMEDVIFAGTSRRPSRNFAEVSLILDNRLHEAPPPYREFEEIEVSRKIERDKGSTYKINGRTVRQRDVMLLFADTMSGAHSPALVSQGRIAAMISAKPVQRRQVLEESAGVSGLYRRRHEAELKLRGAEKNLERVSDVVNSLQGRLGALRRQARQAEKYKQLSSDIREFNIILAYMEWKQAYDNLKSTEAVFHRTEGLVAENLRVVSGVTQQQIEKSKELPEVRQQEARCSAAYQAQKVALNRIGDEERRVLEQIEQCREQLGQIKADSAYEANTSEDNVVLLEKLVQEERKIAQETVCEPEQIAALDGEKADFLGVIDELEKRYADLMQKGAERKERVNAMEREIGKNRKMLISVKGELGRSERDFEKKQAEKLAVGDVDRLNSQIETLEAKIEQERMTLVDLEASYEVESKKKSSLENKAHDARQNYSRVKSEVEALRSVLSGLDDGDFDPVLGLLNVESGYEVAVTRALGEFIMGALDKDAPVHWLDLDTRQAEVAVFPTGSRGLADFVRVPSALSKAVKYIGVVDKSEDGELLQAELSPGQMLVSLDGDLWRWDGLCVRAGAQDANAARLKQMTKLEELEGEVGPLENIYVQAQQIFKDLEQRLIEQRSNIRDRQRVLQGLDQDVRSERRQKEVLSGRLSGLVREIIQIEEKMSRQVEDVERFGEAVQSGELDLAALVESYLDGDDESILSSMREQLKFKRQGLQDVMLAIEKLTQEQSRRQARSHAIADERLNLKNRSIRAKDQLGKLDQRRRVTQDKLDGIEGRPADIELERVNILEGLGELESRRNVAADVLGRLEVEVSQLNKNLKESERGLAEARETRAMSQGTLNAASDQVQDKADSIERQFEMQPQQLLSHCHLLRNEETGEIAEFPPIDKVRRRKDDLIRERDGIGPVNLRADVEAAEVEQELTTMLNEQNDLSQAIDELRGAIGKLNKEARERLRVAFEHVNSHFSRLFVRLFDGGQAHLALVNSDDPLEAGLEIFAQPPGKSLQSLSLMSGGEQTLASTALIFAMFLTNPSPICVLDEIDAPLDDANVDRVCDLIDEIAEQSETRFVIITHHRLTMARMDRLYGVTMAERGVSQLVSVDMSEQQQLDLLEESVANG